MSSAKKIIQKFGGQSELARLIKKNQSTVQYWANKGTIPAKWHPVLMSLAEQQGIDLVPGDFINATEGNHQTIEAESGLPIARWWGELLVGGSELPCYVLSDGRRIISRSGATDILTEGKGGGNLEKYLSVEGLIGFVPEDLYQHLIDFQIETVVNKTVRGMLAETFVEICGGYVRALEAGVLQTERQKEIAIKASIFLAGCAKVGLIALIDEATGYQYERTQDALRVKLKLFLEEEMRKWEKTFPDQLWTEFGRLTNWKGTLHQRPKYWGKLVMELVYGYLDKDVAEWLKNNAPKPIGNLSYHRWLSEQYGLKKLMEHLWMLVGMASACNSMSELRQKMAEKYGREPVQLTLYLPPPEDK
jgi:hypothetical protein